MNFNGALEHLENGHYLSRKGWNGKGMHISIMRGINVGPSWRDFIVMKDAQGCWVPWLASQTDLLSDDWDTVNI